MTRALFALVLLGVASLSVVVETAAEAKAPAPGDDLVARDLKALEGTWEVASHEVNGNKASDADYQSPKKIVISSGKIDLFEKGEADLPIKIDPAKTPRAIDVYFPGAMMLNAHNEGIYVLEKDQLKICLPLSLVGERPTKFSSEGYRSLYVLRRSK